MKKTKRKNWRVVYHYTSMESFLRIIKDGSISLNDIIKSNDPAEGLYSLQMMEKALDKCYKAHAIPDAEYEKVLEIFKAFSQYEKSFGRLQQVVLSLSLCEPEIPLALWRAYGDNGRGMAIGISKDTLQKIGRRKDMKFKMVHYFTEEEICDKYVKFWMDHINDNVFELEEAIRTKYIEGYFIKRSENSFEREWRLIYTGIDLKNYPTMSPLKRYVNPAVDAYARRDDMVLYYKLPIKEDIIECVYLGPQCKATENEINLILCKNGIKVSSVSSDGIVMR